MANKSRTVAMAEKATADTATGRMPERANHRDGGVDRCQQASWNFPERRGGRQRSSGATCIRPCGCMGTEPAGPIRHRHGFSVPSKVVERLGLGFIRHRL